MTSGDNSRTWAVHLRQLCARYGWEDPLTYLNRDPPSRSTWKEIINTKITAYFEQKLRAAASPSSFLNTFSCNLRGRPHPTVKNMISTWDVKRSRAHLKFLAGNYLTYQVKAAQSGGSARCRLCDTGLPESVSHIISVCSALEEQRNKLLIDLQNLCSLAQTNINLEEFKNKEEVLCQFILDPSSLNLSKRVSPQDPILPEFYKLSRDICYTLDKTRLGLLSQL